MSRRLTRERMVKSSVRVPQRDLDLLYLAAQREGLSQSEFLRKAITETALRVLTNEAKGG